MKAKIYITLKPELLDPAGQAIQEALCGLGFNEVSKVRYGKYLEVELDTQEQESKTMPEASLEQRVDEMCKKFLSNPVVEKYRFEIEEAN